MAYEEPFGKGDVGLAGESWILVDLVLLRLELAAKFDGKGKGGGVNEVR